MELLKGPLIPKIKRRNAWYSRKIYKYKFIQNIQNKIGVIYMASEKQKEH